MAAPPTPDPTLLAGGPAGPRALRPLVETVLAALADGAAARCGPLPRGGPDAVTRRLLTRYGAALPAQGTGAHDALHSLVTALAEGAADPADPHCAAHLHAPPLAVAAAADLAAAALNPSMDSWDQAPAASVLERHLTGALAALVHPAGPAPDALVTTGGTEANLLGALLARERLGPRLTLVCGANAHHSVRRAAWLLGLPAPLVLPTPTGALDPGAVAAALDRLDAAGAARALVVATAGTTDAGLIDPLPGLADALAAHRARGAAALHVDAAYGGPLLLSDAHRAKVAGLDRADSVTLDLHKLGWQPVAAGLLTVPDTAWLAALTQRADYLNAEDDTEAGLPDLLGRSLRTTRRPDILKIAVTIRALGTTGLAALVDSVCDAARALAALVAAEPRLTLWARPTISTVLFRPAGAADEQVAAIRRRLLAEGRAVLGRACALDAAGRPALWLKATLLNPQAQHSDLAALIKLVLDQADHTTEPEHPEHESPAKDGSR
ncbi:pyridoxal phosphate-dependent decarboxylase family protein [Streptomyces radicis]|uniref:Aspartate aminotransferase family protein n=1 Tax=Streptomyces radicis TaxID=1750517 RepID=A0A3A9WE71_9ACTN|nr:pyridoxal-dependent decarboxylase [Streptomyces radicis]RKN04337.1 aspartate aminotransferase family protein [Streptomyces radicis]RKN14844.1 aspartate aminotransferase family protein [Streptomyces radicis]